MEYNLDIRNNILYLEFSGKLMAFNKNDELYNVIDGHLVDGVCYCAIDISELQFINSHGLGLLVTVLTKFRNKGGEVILVKPSEHINKLLIITKLAAIFTIVETKEEALARFQTFGQTE